MVHTTVIAKNQERKQTLKLEICNYFTAEGVSREILAKLCAAMITDAEKAVSGFGIPRAGTFAQSKVAPRHRAKVSAWVERLADILEIEKEAEEPEEVEVAESQEDYWDRTDDARAYV